MVTKTILDKLSNSTGRKYKKELKRALHVMSLRYGGQLQIEKVNSGINLSSCAPNHICVFTEYVVIDESGKEVMTFMQIVSYSVMYATKTVERQFSIPEHHQYLISPYTLWERFFK